MRWLACTSTVRTSRVSRSWHRKTPVWRHRAWRRGLGKKPGPKCARRTLRGPCSPYKRGVLVRTQLRPPGQRLSRTSRRIGGEPKRYARRPAVILPKQARRYRPLEAHRAAFPAASTTVWRMRGKALQPRRKAPGPKSMGSGLRDRPANLERYGTPTPYCEAGRTSVTSARPRRPSA